MNFRELRKWDKNNGTGNIKSQDYLIIIIVLTEMGKSNK